jgi:ferredoxin
MSSLALAPFATAPVASRPRLAITVDPHRCVGSTLCTLIAPQTFALNAEGQSVVVDPAGDSLATILNAAEQCPMMAITVRDAVTGESYFDPG